MNEKEARELLINKISLTRQNITIAKANILELLEDRMDSHTLINQVLHKLEKQLPEKIIIDGISNSIAFLDDAADAISWRVAISEAIWELIHNNLIFPTISDLNENSFILKYDIVYGSDTRYSGSLELKEYYIPIPRRVRKSILQKDKNSEFLVNPDLYLHNLDIPNIHPEVADSLHEAIKCFKHNLFTSSITMLGRASEGVWIELGSTLFYTLSENEFNQIAKHKNNFDNPAFGVGKKIEIITSLYERQDLLSNIAKKSGVSLPDLRQVATWSTTLQEARNIIHFGNTPSLPTTYEKVAVFLLDAVPHFRVLYKIITSS